VKLPVKENRGAGGKGVPYLYQPYPLTKKLLQGYPIFVFKQDPGHSQNRIHKKEPNVKGRKEKKIEKLFFTGSGRITTHLGALVSTRSGKRGLAFSR
jgi:hypothetical protein